MSLPMLLGLLPVPAVASAPDLVLFNGKLFTADPRRPETQAIAIRGDRIVAVGSDAVVKGLVGPNTRLVDLAGRRVIPGLNDAHAHLSMDPGNEILLETQSYDPSWSELRETISKTIGQAPVGAILFGNIGTTVFGDRTVDRAKLDEVSPDRPVILGTFDGHAAILNSAALKLLAIAEDVADPMGGRYERDGVGRLTGVVREYAYDAVLGRLAALASDADAEASLRDDLKSAARYGLTTIQDMPVSGNVDRTARLLAHIPTPIRVRITRMNGTTPAGPDYAEGAGAPPHPAPLVSVNGTKWVLDGVVFEGSLSPRASRSDPTDANDPHGFAGLPPLFSPPVIDRMLKDALQHHYQLQVHVFGTPAAREMLDAMERLGGASVWFGRRVRFEHGDGLTPELIARVKRMGVIVSQQGSHLDIRDIDPALGRGFFDRLQAERAQPLRSLLAAGIPVALGSDGPLNPWLGILGATTHPDRPEEAITREQALIAYTRGSAYAQFEESDKGILAPGKLADLAVLSQDVLTVPATDLLKTRSVLTLVGGRVAYDAHVLAQP